MAYKAVIGLEFHCEMTSHTKVFSNAINGFSKLPNQLVAPLDMAFPGTLPVVNKECVKKSLMMSLILNCKQPEYLEFDRKNYYYPDLPKGYQLTQFYNPIGVNGEVEIQVNGENKIVKIHDIHLDEDTASLDHYYDTSNLDYNRAGVPLLELVTEPCLNSADEAIAFLEHIKSIYQYTNISECDSKKGQIRADVNVSIMDEDSNELGTKVEVKNVNSFDNIRKTINYEIERQTALKDAGRYDEVVQETRRWDDEKGITVHMRSKADAIDYRYFTEPNIPRYKITKEYIESVRKSIPELAHERKEKYINVYGLSNRDAKILVKEKALADYFEETINLGANPQSVANWLISIILGHLNKMELNIKDLFLTPQMLKGLIDMVETNKISIKQAKEILPKALEEEKDPVKLVSELGITQ